MADMHLLLWRHAEAEDDADDDMARRLTPRGVRQAAAVAAWLRRHGPRDLRILVSPATRAQQTAAALGRPFETLAAIAPNAGAPALLAAAGWSGEHSGSAAVLLVGHQPALGQLAAMLMGAREASWTIRKGALWWLSRRQRDAAPQIVLRTVLAPDQLGQRE